VFDVHLEERMKNHLTELLLGSLLMLSSSVLVLKPASHHSQAATKPYPQASASARNLPLTASATAVRCAR